MTPDDEAFIRAIVDRPGDDLTRLVYADWLDERGDPRGAYLRAEHEWAAGPRTNPPQAVGLDLVWVARVSRPPAGVCCDHIEWAKRGPNASDAEIISIEQEIGTSLPPDYRAFALNQNGAEFDTSDDDDGGWRFMPLDAIRDVYHCYSPTLRDVRESSPDAIDWRARLLCIGQGFEIIDQLMLCLAGRNRGMVCVMDSQVPLESNHESFLSGYKPHTATFAEFLSLLPKGPTPNRNP